MTLELAPGEIHALLGENGAGKTTLANVLAGRRAPDTGARLAGGRIGFVHQHFAIPPGLTSAECLCLEEARLRWLSRRELHRRFREIASSSGLDLGDPDAPAAELSVGERQRLELARAAWRQPDLLILDEPTAVLAPPEIDAFADYVRGIARRGAAVLFITHKLPEVFLLASRVTLLRRGRLVWTRPRKECFPEEVAAEFLEGAAPGPSPVRASPPEGEAVLVLRDLSARGDRGELALAGLSLEVRAGEIVAIVGVDGNGQSELAECLAGVRCPAGGDLLLGGRRLGEVSFRSTGSSVVPEDRQREGLIPEFSVEENLRLAEPIRDIPPLEAEGLIRRFAIAAPDRRTPVSRLSGGNRQKVVLARELSRSPSFLLAVSPTRGLDLPSTRMTRSALRDAAGRGAAILLVTPDLEEAREVAGRVHVLYRGRLSPAFLPGAPPAAIGRAMAGIA